MKHQIYEIPAKERRLYIETASTQIGISATMIEKDYWVVFVLQNLFSLKDLKDHLTFKGGTSLSKIYNLIKRFSEDIDLSIEKYFFGFSGKEFPENVASRKQKDKALKDLSDECSNYVQKSLLDSLSKLFSVKINFSNTWDLLIDDTDETKQTILFKYPTVFEMVDNYIRPTIKIEIGARGEHWPVSYHPISSYLKENLKDNISEPEVKVKVLNAERTFWEKATILHQYANIPEKKRIPLRISRHYYDFYQLLNSPIKKLALDNIDLLEKVVHHKEIYFYSSWANYVSAKKGSLKLVPPDRIKTDLKNDYRLMEGMFFEEQPKWDKGTSKNSDEHI